MDGREGFNFQLEIPCQSLKISKIFATYLGQGFLNSAHLLPLTTATKVELHRKKILTKAERSKEIHNEKTKLFCFSAKFSQSFTIIL